MSTTNFAVFRGRQLVSLPMRRVIPRLRRREAKDLRYMSRGWMRAA
jgi:hypothetical protein